MSNLSRRSLVTSAAALPALAIPAVAAAAAPVDPVFAAIAAHRETYVKMMRACRMVCLLPADDPREAELEAAADAASEIEHEARAELSSAVPATMVGVIGLLQYLGEFQEQAIELPEDPRHWHSETPDGDSVMRTTYEAPDLFDKFNGRPLELPFAYWVMRNVREALESLSTVQS